MSDNYSKYFCESKSSNAVWNVTKTLLQTTFFWTIFLAIIPFFIVKCEKTFQVSHFQFLCQKESAVVLFILASTLGLVSGITMALVGRGTPLPLNCTQDPVFKGPYKYVRNPMAIAGLLQGSAIGIWMGSWFILIYVIIGMVLWNQWVRPIEEGDLLNRFGSNYENYQRQIKCWIPNFRGYQK